MAAEPGPFLWDTIQVAAILDFTSKRGFPYLKNKGSNAQIRVEFFMWTSISLVNKILLTKTC